MNPQPPECRRCGAMCAWRKEDVGRGWRFSAWCMVCRVQNTRPAEPYAHPDDRTWWPSRMFADPDAVTTLVRGSRECQVCRADVAFTELHHLAPTALFGFEEANRWPTVEVCTTCHDRWHALVWPGVAP